MECILEFLLKNGIPTPISDIEGFDSMDQPISYYENDDTYYDIGSIHRVFTEEGLVNIVIYFNKPKDDIYIERNNDSCMCELDEDECSFCKGFTSDIMLSEVPKDCPNFRHDSLYGFAVRNILPSEIDRVCFYTPLEGDIGKLIYQVKRN